MKSSRRGPLLAAVAVALLAVIGGGVALWLATRPDEPVVDPVREYVDGMVKLPSGEFGMGSDARTHRIVTLTRAFRIGTTEVTQELYRAVTGDEPSDFVGDRNPVETVSWVGAVEFCNALSRAEGIEPAYRIEGDDVTWSRGSVGFRLPTEAEWEYAALAGRFTTYPGSSIPGDVAWYSRNSGMRTHPVGQLLPNAWGLYDMAGNVHEWVWDRHGPLDGGDHRDPAGPDEGEHRVYRGGSWGGNPEHIRVTARDHGPPDLRRRGLGFRVARYVEPVLAER